MKRTLAGVFLVLGLDGFGFAGAPPLVRLEMKDGVLTPQRLEVAAGQAFQLEIRNAGRAPAEFESKALKQEKVLPPGGTVTLAIRALPAGHYAFVDEFQEQLPTARGEIVAR